MGVQVSAGCLLLRVEGSRCCVVVSLVVFFEVFACMLRAFGSFSFFVGVALERCAQRPGLVQARVSF